MASTLKIVSKEVGLSTGLNVGMSTSDISQTPDAATVSKSVVGVTGQIASDIFETAATTSINVARKSGMSWSKAISKGLSDGATKPLQFLKASKAAADATKAAKAVRTAAKASAKIAEKIGATAAEKATAKAAQEIAEKVAEKAVQKATTQAAALGTKWTALSATGPVGWAIVIVQLTFAILDILWNPFQTYFNKDLAELKETIDLSIRKQFLENGSDYPLEIKPSVMPSTDEEIDEYYRLKKEYYENNGLISSEDVLKEENLYNEINLLQRNMRIALNPLYDNINLYSGTTQNIVLLIAAAAAKKRGYGKKFSKAIDLKNYTPSTPYKKYVTWVKFNWQLLVSISVILILIICSSMLLFFV